MKILHVCQPTNAGVANVVLTLVADQVARGWEIHVACPPDKVFSEALEQAGAILWPWPASRSPGVRTIPETVALAKIVKRIQPDVLHLHSAKAGLAGRLATRGNTITIFHPHAWSFYTAAGRFRRVIEAWERAASRWTTALIAVSSDEANDGRDIGVTSPIRVIPNGIAVQAVAPPAFPPTRKTVVCVGRLCEQKGQDRLISAWPAIRAKVPEAELVLVGAGPSQPELERQAAGDDSIRFVGHSSDPGEWISEATVVAFPSRWEAGFPLAAMEAMAMARPVVATAFNGASSGVQPGCGQVVPQWDETKFVEAVTARLADADVAEDEGRRSREVALRRFEAEATCAEVATLYERLRCSPSQRTVVLD